VADWIIPVNGTEYPKLKWQYPPSYSGGSGTADDPYQIANKEDILSLADARLDWDKSFILIADVDMGWTIFPNAIIAMNIATGDNILDPFISAIPGFKGTFDGHGHTISHFIINGNKNSYLGLFGYIESKGQIKNLGLENYTINGLPVRIMRAVWQRSMRVPLASVIRKVLLAVIIMSVD